MIISTEGKITISECTPATVGTVEKPSGLQIEDNGTLSTAASPVNDCLATWANCCRCCTVALVDALGVKLHSSSTQKHKFKHIIDADMFSRGNIEELPRTHTNGRQCNEFK